MTNEEFVQSVRIAVFDGSIEGSLQTLRQVAGRKPHARLVEMSRWFNALSENDQARVADVIQDATRAAVFNMLCVLDNVISVRPSVDAEVGYCRLWYETETGSTLLNDEKLEMLHDIFAGEVPPG